VPFQPPSSSAHIQQLVAAMCAEHRKAVEERQRLQQRLAATQQALRAAQQNTEQAHELAVHRCGGHGSHVGANGALLLLSPKQPAATKCWCQLLNDGHHHGGGAACG